METGFNAKRFAGKPLKQPLYKFCDVPRCIKGLSGSSVFEVQDREHLTDAMSEMVLLCNEAIRRSNKARGKNSSKPLSLEYIADRLDVDDPLWGYVVRDDQGRMQGFITYTTFTNWQKTFRWDSNNEAAFGYDHDELAQEMQDGERNYDEGGELAVALQKTVRCGDPWNEGIVWPRLAEISLLGGLGCGKALLSLVIDRLEGLRPTASHNYEYIVLQATENSVPFYESMGFVRVGAIVEDEKPAKRKSTDDTESEADTESENDDSSSNASSSSRPSEILSSPVFMHVVTKPGETPADIAKRFKVDVWDIIFLNHFIYSDIQPKSYLMKGTSLFIPSEDKSTKAVTSRNRVLDTPKDDGPKWYVAKENDTPRRIARKFQVDCNELVLANQYRFPELLPTSRLKEGTQIKVSHFDVEDDKYSPYTHWTFPDDDAESNDPSYMMVRKLNRRQGKAKKSGLLRTITVKKFVPPPESLFERVKLKKQKAVAVRPRKASMPRPPTRPPSGYLLFCNDVRVSQKEELAGKHAFDIVKLLGAKWKQLEEDEKVVYQEQHQELKESYDKAMAKYKKDLERFKHKNDAVESNGGTTNLFNKVVKLRRDIFFEPDFEYYYVLTYIPDLQWCHLAPLKKVGVWGPEEPSAEGRPKWMLVDESEGKEIDISASFCERVTSRGLRGTVDADEERWDIPGSRHQQGDSELQMHESGDGWENNSASEEPMRSQSEARSATKPMTGAIERKRKRSSVPRLAKTQQHETEPCPASPTGSQATSGEQSHRQGAPVLLGSNLSPKPKRSKTPDSSSKSPVCKVNKATRSNAGNPAGRQSTRRELPRRKAAPLLEGAFCETESEVETDDYDSDDKSADSTDTDSDVEPPSRARGVYRQLPHRKAAPVPIEQRAGRQSLVQKHRQRRNTPS